MMYSKLAMATLNPTPTAPPIVLPMGLGGQLRAVQEAHREQAERIVRLEREMAELRSDERNMKNALARIAILEKQNANCTSRIAALEKQIANVVSQIAALEQYNANLAARRREAVAQFLNLRVLHQEADHKAARYRHEHGPLATAPRPSGSSVVTKLLFVGRWLKAPGSP